MSRRQIILIMTDTQPVDVVGCYGNSQALTPQLDRLAGEGVRFDAAYCCQPVCGPARAAMFTGTYPHSNASWANTMALDQRTLHVGQRLTRAGVRTGYVGKWHLDGWEYFGEGVCPDGWADEYWYDMRRYLDELSEEERRKSRRTDWYKDSDFSVEKTFGRRCSNKAVDFVEKFADEDFLLVVSYDEPHHPFVCPGEYHEMHAGTRLPVKENVTDPLTDKPEHIRLAAQAYNGGRREPTDPVESVTHRDYLACNSFVDNEIGRVLDAAERCAPDALIIYTADHGASMRSHSLSDKLAAMYEEITRIPLIVRWPGQAPAGAASRQLASHVDLVPTMLDYFGVEIPELLQGRSLLRTFASPDTATRDELFIEFNRYEIDHDGWGGFQPVRCVVDGRYKLAVSLLDETDELYDLRDDPQEMTNLIDSPEHADVRDALHEKLLAWMDETRDPFRGYHWECRPWRGDAKPDWRCHGMTRQRVPDVGEREQLDYDTGLPVTEYTRPK